MNVVMDADCLIKLTKAQLKEAVCATFRIAIPSAVRLEVMANAADHPECAVVHANLESGALGEVPGHQRSMKGEEAVLAVYRSGTYAGVASDDKRFIKKLRIMGVPFITPAVFVLLLVTKAHVSVAVGLAKLEQLAPLISADEVAVVRLKLENLREKGV